MATYYVDLTAGNDTTGDGSSGNPWLTEQHALDSISGGATAGPHTLKIKGSRTNSGPLSFTTFGSPTITKPLVFDIWGTDSDVWTISGSGNYLPSVGHVTLKQLRLTGTVAICGAATGGPHALIRCDFQPTGFTYFPGGSGGKVLGCRIPSAGTLQGGIDAIVGCWIKNTVAQGTSAAVTAPYVVGNVIAVAGSCGVLNRGGVVNRNTIYNSNPGANQFGIFSYTGGASHQEAAGNLIVGFSGTGGGGIQGQNGSVIHCRSNRFYNCTSNLQSGTTIDLGDNTTLASNPLRDVASDDYRLTTAAAVDAALAGWPADWIGVSYGNGVLAGAIQPASSGGGLSRSRLVNAGGV